MDKDLKKLIFLYGNLFKTLIFVIIRNLSLELEQNKIIEHFYEIMTTVDLWISLVALFHPQLQSNQSKRLFLPPPYFHCTANQT